MWDLEFSLFLGAGTGIYRDISVISFEVHLSGTFLDSNYSACKAIRIDKHSCSQHMQEEGN